MHFHIILFSSLLALCLCSYSFAETPTGEEAWHYADTEEDKELRKHLDAKIQEIMADPAKYEEAMSTGERRVALCKHCHGVDGNAVLKTVPAGRNKTIPVPHLAGQNPIYIIDQFQRFADGRREDFFMGALAKSFEEDDKIKLAVYYSQQKLKSSVHGTEAQRQQGKKIYDLFCAECHGAKGNSDLGYARLAGQDPDYIVKMLNEFKKNDGRRYNPFMRARAFMIKTEEEAEAVASYLASLPE